MSTVVLVQVIIPARIDKNTRKETACDGCFYEKKRSKCPTWPREVGHMLARLKCLSSDPHSWHKHPHRYVMIWFRGSQRNHLNFYSDGNEHEQHGPGLYFTDNGETAAQYGDVAEFNISGKIINDSQKPDKALIRKLISIVPKDMVELALSNWDENPKIAMNAMVVAMLSGDSMVDSLQTFWHDVCNLDDSVYLDVCRKAGIDGIEISISSDEHWLVLYDMSKAKRIEEQKS